MSRQRESIRTKAARVRRPRVHITYQTELQGEVQERSLPFAVGVLANFSGYRPTSRPLRDRRFQPIDADSFSDVLARMRPYLAIEIDETPVVELEFSSLNDFTPQALLTRVPLLNRLWMVRTDLLARKGQGITSVSDLLNEHGLAIPIAAKGDEQVALAVEELDRILSSRLTAIIQHSDFRALESSWRALWYLVVQTETSEDVKIEILDISRRELFKDLDQSVEFDQSLIFKKVFEDRLGTLGGDPFGVLIGDYEFSHSPEDVDTLVNLAQVAAAAQAPFVAAASAEIFGLDDFAQLTMVRDVSRCFESIEYLRWQSFRESEDARWIALTLPRMLIRTPYHYQSEEPDPYLFLEHTQRAEEFLWSNPAFALAACMTRAYAEEHWVTNIQGSAGGRVANLPVAMMNNEDGDLKKVCTSVIISDRLEAMLADLGFVALCLLPNRDDAAFFGVPSCQKPKSYDSSEATGNARILMQIPAIMACARFSQYLMVISRDTIGSFKERGDYEHLLNRWLEKYVSRGPVDSDEIRAKHPLREGHVSVVEVPGKPGAFHAIVYLRPQYGMEGLTVSFRLVVRLPLSGT